MGRPRTLQDLISDVRNRTNMETSTFVTDGELTEYLNQAISELHGRLTQNGGQPFYRSVTTINVVPGTAYYNLPQDFMALEGVDATLNGWTGRLDSFMASEHARMSNLGNYLSLAPVRYRLAGNTIEILPAIYTFPATVYYVPSCPRLINLSDTFDGFDGYEVAAIYDACATVQSKEETDPSFYLGQRDRIYKQIDSLSAARDMSAPERVADVQSGRDDFAWPYFGGTR